MASPRVPPGLKKVRQRQHIFLAAYVKSGSLTAASEITKIDRARHYEWLHRYPEYREEFAACTTKAIDTLEEEAKRRAMSGSDPLMMFMLKAKRPQEFRDISTSRVDGKMVHHLNIQGSIQHAHAHVKIDPESLDADQCRLLLSLLDAQKQPQTAPGEQPAQLTHRQAPAPAPDTIILSPAPEKTRTGSADDFFDE